MRSLRGPAINGHALRALRLSRGMSLVQLAALAGLDHSYLSRLERGQRRWPAPSIAKNIADALNVPMAAVLADPSVLEAS